MIDEIIAEASRLLRADAYRGLALTAGLAVLVALDLLVSGRWPRAARGLFLASCAAATAAGLYFAWQVKWLCDDAFITFAYSQNFARGMGLVFNPGEWVEGYTNFLWALLLGVVGKLGADIPLSALFGNLVSFAAVLWLSAAIASAGSKPVRPTFPFAAIALAASTPFTTWATSGLETMPATLCIVAAAWRALKGGTWSVGLLICLAAMARPDHSLFGPAMLVAMAIADWRHGEGLRWKRLLAFCAPFALVFIPFWLFRWKLYGQFFPNTYYAKSGGLTYFSQGAVYVVHYLATTGAWLLVPVFLVAGLKRSRSREDTLLWVFSAVGAALLGLFVFRVGGDFMEHRFLLVLLPLLATSLELSVRAQRGRVVTALAVVAMAVFALKVKPIGPWEKRWHLAAEETFYALTHVSPLAIASRNFEFAHVLVKTFAQSEVKPRVATGCVGFVGYYSGLPVSDTFGLTNPQVAHKPIAVRGRPGHEKRADLEDVLADGAVFADEAFWAEWRNETRLDLPGFSGHFVQYDPEVAAAVRRAGGRAADVEAEIARHAQAWGRAELTRAHAFFEKYLEKDPKRAQRLEPLTRRLAQSPEERVSALSPESVPEAVRALERELPPDDPTLVKLRDSIAARWSFDEPALPSGWQRTGSTFTAPVEGPLLAQTPISGKQGVRLLNSYEGGDGPTGRLELELPASGGVLVGLLVGGSGDCARAYVGLVVGEQVVQRACGQQDEVLRPAVLTANPGPGQRARLVIVDEASNAWGHLLVDDVMLIARP